MQLAGKRVEGSDDEEASMEAIRAWYSRVKDRLVWDAGKRLYVEQD